MSCDMERTKLIFTHDKRTIGTLTKQLNGENEVEVYTPVILFNFMVTGYISGPRPGAPNKFAGYRVKVLFTGGEEAEVVINHTTVNSFQRFIEALRLNTHGVIFTYNQFDEALWPDLWARLYYHCTEEKVCKKLRPADNIGIQYKYLDEMEEKNGQWTSADYEEEYSDRVLGSDGEIKESPIHIFVPELAKKAKVGTPAFKASGLKGLMEMMNPPYTHHNQEIRSRQLVALMAAGALRYYRFIVNQVGACPTLLFGSKAPSTCKTATALLCQKVFGFSNLFMAPGTSLPSIELTKSLTSFSVLLDDVENLLMRHKLIMDGYNGASKTTIERGEEIKLAGMLMSFNITSKERLHQKEDEGRTLLHHFVKADLDNLEFDEAFDSQVNINFKITFKELEQVEHHEAMRTRASPHDFHAKFGAKNFQSEPGDRSNWQVEQRIFMPSDFS